MGEGYYEEILKEDICLEPEDWSKKEFKLIKDIFGFKDSDNVERIVIPEGTTLKWFIE